MTAHAMQGDVDRCLNAGMDGYVSKPLNRPCSARSWSRTSRRLRRVLDLRAHHALERLGGDEHLLSEVIQLFLDDCPARLTAIKAAVDRRLIPDLCREAHALKGAAANLSALSLFEAVRILEQVGTEGRIDALDAAWRRVSDEAAHVLHTLRQEHLAG
jgi:HPt (histidine-containing phosphotransfer) domain-containing protein